MLSNISGFPELLPNKQIVFDYIVKIIKQQFELYGFTPLDTPAVERRSTLLSKGNDNEIYGIHRIAETQGSKDKDLALRFDLTVPLARYVAQHYGKLIFPYKRYHIAPVWRGERPQSGRYRQFYQCDIDIIGNIELPLIYDVEVLSIAHNIFHAIGIKNFVTKINNRKILTGLIKTLCTDEEMLLPIMRTIDKVEKITKNELYVELLSHGLNEQSIKTLEDFITQKKENKEWIKYLKNMQYNQKEFKDGVLELEILIKDLEKFLTSAEINKHIQIDPTIARGLNYYTGTIYETKLTDYPELGSICGGGRYKNLVTNFIDRQLPGVGLSIGISRLIPKLIEANIITAETETTASTLVTTQDQNFILNYIEISQTLRNHDINTETYFAQKQLSSQLKYAGKKGFKFVIIANKDELKNKHVIVRSLKTGEQHSLSIAEVINFIKNN
ncbi:Histidine--tRNA ligase [Candidatus Xenohaliotis californiensis]|uniref:Histidine--tRNA ligase n=1 Tax=Candidatus Xenohaliotis californiensis TaxID=84677 RepID=A0ABP0EV16_9RICK|nr:Histidine--tRNA ligase [Candidatus Xenohaliotis californiensis]